MTIRRHVLGLTAAGFHELSYLDHGTPGLRPDLLCVHGLTRNAHDFDALAGVLSADRRVVAVDMPGRGESAWLPAPELYGYPTYLADMAVLIGALGRLPVDLVGTSMGGIVGMMLAAQPQTPLRRLVLNDVGAWIPRAALQAIADYVGRAPSFDDLEGLERYLREIHAGFGDLTDEEWRAMTRRGHRRLADGRYALGYDPAIGEALRAGEIGDVDLWALWDRIEIPVLVLRGERSELLPAAVAEEMRRRGPRAEVVEIPGCGHAPSLTDPRQIAIIRAWLDG